MFCDWDVVQNAMVPIKDYEDLIGRFQVAFQYSFVRASYNLTMPQHSDYARRLLESDTRGRYAEYAALLVKIFNRLDQAGIGDTLDLMARVEKREQLKLFAEQNSIYAHEVVHALKYLAYWVIPAEKYLSGLVRNDAEILEAIQTLRRSGIRTNLHMLEAGIHAAGRKALAEASGLPEAVILELVNRADFSRLPWASKATISNIMGAGYTSLAELATADPEKLYADFFQYGRAIGKNLKLGNEIENSYRIAKIVPVLVQQD